MKNLFLILLASASTATLFATDVKDGEQVTYKVNTEQSTVIWKGYKVTGSHHGVISLKEGSVMMKGNQLTGGHLVMDMTSIEVRDLNGEYKGKLEGHLKSDDFFGVASNPESSLKVTNVVAKDGGFLVTADLTIKGITEPVEFMAYADDTNGTLKATAELKVDRSKYNVRYGSNSFFDNLGDKAIYDEFDLKVELVLDQQAS